MIQVKLPALGDKVKFVRIQNGEAGKEDVLVHGEGTVVGLIIGIQKRVNVMVKDSETSLNKAWTLEPMCINPEVTTAAAYFQHRQRISQMVKEINDKSAAVIEEGNQAIDRVNAEMFGEPLEL